MLFKIALRNVLRNKRRSGLTFLGIGLGLTLVIIFQGVISGMDTQITDNFIRAQAGHIQLHAQGYEKKARLMSLDARVKQPDALAAQVRQIPGVAQVAQRIQFGALIGTRRESLRALGLALQPEQERATSPIAQSIVAGNYLDDQPGYALIGKSLAEDLSLEVGDVLTLVSNTASGALNAIDAEIKGIFYTGYAQIDSATVVITLADGQALLDMPGQVTELAVTLHSIDDTDAVAGRLASALSQDGLEIKTWQEAGAAIWQVLQLRRWLLGIISVIVIAIAALGIVNTMLMSVFERTREIGTLLALGNTPGEVLRLFLTESALIGVAGGLFGILLGGSVVGVLAVVGIQPPSALTNVIDAPFGTTIYASFSWQVLLLFCSLAMGVAMLSAVYPAFLASRQEPVDALRHV